MPTDANALDLKGAPRHGAFPTDEDLFWPAAMRQVQTGTMAATQWAAAAVIVCALVGWGLVAGMMLFRADQMASFRGFVRIGFLTWMLPLLWWSLAIIWAIRVFTVRRYRYFANSPDSSHQAVVRISRKKAEHLYWAMGLWCAGVIALVCALFYEIARRG